MNNIIRKHPVWSLQAAARAREQGRALFRNARGQPAGPAASRPGDRAWLNPLLALPAVKFPLIF